MASRDPIKLAYHLNQSSLPSSIPEDNGEGVTRSVHLPASSIKSSQTSYGSLLRTWLWKQVESVSCEI